MVLNLGKCYYLNFDSDTTQNEFVLEDGTIVPSAEGYVILEMTFLFLFAVMQKGCK